VNIAAIYEKKLTTPEKAVQVIESGMRVYIGGGAGVPQVLEQAMLARADQLRNVEVIHVLTFSGGEYLKPEYAESFRHRALFLGGNARQAVWDGRADYTPVFLSEIPALLRDGSLPLDVVLIQVSPPDEHGFCSFGIEVGVTKPAAQAAKIIIAEINPNMPRVLGDSFIHISKLNIIVDVNYPLPTVTQGEITPVFDKIGANVADLIPDGATLQLGIGAIPDAVLNYLGSKRDLGIHSEMFSDGVIELIEQGVITNDKKTLHPGKIIGGFLFGNKDLYDFVNDNAMIELHPSDYVNDPFIIAQNDKMVAINSAIEVDLTGQVCADSIGTKFYSGIGGQVDFIRGAARSKGGIPIIALPSTAKKDSVSRIVPRIKSGAGVVTSRGDVHYVVTEYGVANLHGKSVRERAEALIAIAHPDFREELQGYIREQNWNLANPIAS
jgi:acetyl-CoA hydrolase